MQSTVCTAEGRLCGPVLSAGSRASVTAQSKDAVLPYTLVRLTADIMVVFILAVYAECARKHDGD